jgi:hypothetical protein
MLLLMHSGASELLQCEDEVEGGGGGSQRKLRRYFV